MALGLGSLKKQADNKHNTNNRSKTSSQSDDVKKLQEQMDAKADAGLCPFC